MSKPLSKISELHRIYLSVNDSRRDTIIQLAIDSLKALPKMPEVKDETKEY